MFVCLFAKRLGIIGDKLPDSVESGIYTKRVFKGLLFFLHWAVKRGWPPLLPANCTVLWLLLKRTAAVCDVSFLLSQFSPGSCPESLAESHLYSLTGFQTKEGTFSTGSCHIVANNAFFYSYLDLKQRAKLQLYLLKQTHTHARCWVSEKLLML